ncbi:hypothetical protein FGO68_gene8441 [Halteria grandinella]|uniref:Uncharacterized protein n=1 Tax=Halteria grandinella TaxID=5974 RepID=A0A8J8T1R4_HALGN|nr:hypothetical protein FGO68_gene8441 [Halteria grandinella]
MCISPGVPLSNILKTDMYSRSSMTKSSAVAAIPAPPPSQAPPLLLSTIVSQQYKLLQVLQRMIIEFSQKYLPL